METLVEKKHIMKKVIFLLVFIILFDFISPQINWAANTTTTPSATNVVAGQTSAAGMGYEAAEWVGGVLWTPIQALFLGLRRYDCYHYAKNGLWTRVFLYCT